MGITLHNYTHLCSELVTISSPDSAGRVRTTVGNLEEIGEWSAKLLVDRPIQSGVGVVVNAGVNTLKGTVKAWSYEPVMGYFIDVQLNRESRWSPKHFQPEHLLRIEDMVQGAESAAA